MSWKLSSIIGCWISCPVSASHPPPQLKISLPVYLPGYRKCRGNFQNSQTVKPWLRRVLVRRGFSAAQYEYNRGLHFYSLRVNPSPFTCSRYVRSSDPQQVYTLTVSDVLGGFVVVVLFFCHLGCSLVYVGSLPWLARRQGVAWKRPVYVSSLTHTHAGMVQDLFTF